MITLSKAKQIAEQYLKSTQEKFLPGEELVFDDSDITEFDLVWLFRYTTRKYKETLDEESTPYRRPIMVCKDDGGIYSFHGPHHPHRVASKFDKNHHTIFRVV